MIGILGRDWVRLRLLSRLVAVALLLVLEPASHALALDRRVALVLGNADYATAPKLDNSVNDASAVRDALSRIGFEIYFGVNLKRIDTEELLKRFYRAADGASISLFYYAGHGLQLAGSNYLVPIDANLTSVSDIQLQAMNVDDIFQYLRLHTSAQLIFLDACRSNPAAGRKYWVVDTLRPSTRIRASRVRRRASAASSLTRRARQGRLRRQRPKQPLHVRLRPSRRDAQSGNPGDADPRPARRNRGDGRPSGAVGDFLAGGRRLSRPRAGAPAAEPLTQIAIPKADEPAPLNVPLPRAGSDAPLKIVIEQLPDKGRLLVGGKQLTGPVQLGPDEFRTLASIRPASLRAP